MDSQSLVSVRLNEGLEAIGGGCFQYCELRRLVLPSSVTSVGANAFYFCSQMELADLSAADRLKSLGSGAFSQCSQLRRAVLGAGLESICEGCFYQNMLEEVAIPGSVMEIGRAAFQGNSHLRHVRFLSDGQRSSCRI